jgi:AraC-like DNA-binding protein
MKTAGARFLRIPATGSGWLAAGQQTAASVDPEFEDELERAGFCVSKLARTRGLSVRQLERQFRQRFGNSPREVVMEYRMAFALKRMMARVPLKQIAGELGYSNPANFTHAFQRYYGASPSEMLRKRPVKSNSWKP